MTKVPRVRTVLAGLVMIGFCAALLTLKEEAFALIVLVVCVSLLIKGVHSLIYYATMARHMVGGRLQFYKGLFMLDIGLTFLMMEDIPGVYIMLYLMIGNVIAGIIDVMRALEAKKLKSGSWKLNMAGGIINIVSGVACAACLGKTEILVYIYMAGLFYTACIRILSAFRRTAIIYIP